MAHGLPFRLSEALAPSDIDAANHLNIALMVLAVFVAAVIPFELFMLAYAVLGPLHYLSEISWLHDRRYFSSSDRSWIFLLLPVVPILLGLLFSLPHQGKIFAILMGTTFMGATGLVFTERWSVRWLLISIAGVVSISFFAWRPFVVLFAVALPTLIHVYIFTGLFILYGALKSRSKSGLLSVLVFALCPYACLYLVSTPAGYVPHPRGIDASVPFEPVFFMMRDLFGLPQNMEGVTAFMRLMAFAYTYHYLNWFSKTRVINWHRISRSRLISILVIYATALGFYAFSFNAGFIALYSLSMAHVVLEFPLNYRSVTGIVAEIRRR